MCRNSSSYNEKREGRTKNLHSPALCLVAYVDLVSPPRKSTKNLKDGSVNKYIYYGCTRARDINCKGGYIEEKVLIAQLLELMDKIDLRKLGSEKT